MLNGNKAIVTGASRGIGFSIAKELSENGCKVVARSSGPDASRGVGKPHSADKHRNMFYENPAKSVKSKL